MICQANANLNGREIKRRWKCISSAVRKTLFYCHYCVWFGGHTFNLLPLLFWQIISIDCTKTLQVHVRYLRLKGGGVYLFPSNEDTDYINICSIEAILQEPEIRRRGELYFEELQDRASLFR
jgi:hypothetical protein